MITATEDFVYSLVRHLDRDVRSSSSSRSSSDKRSRSRDDREERGDREDRDRDDSPHAGRKRRSSDHYRHSESDRPSKRRDYRDLDDDQEHHHSSRSDRYDGREEGECDRQSPDRESANPGLADWSDNDYSVPRGRRDSRGSRGRGRGQRRGDRRGGRGFNTRDSSTIIVRNIPKENNSITSLNEYFSQFGTIVNIEVRLIMDLIG